MKMWSVDKVLLKGGNKDIIFRVCFLFINDKTSCEISLIISYHIPMNPLAVITHPCPNFNGDLANCACGNGKDAQLHPNAIT